MVSLTLFLLCPCVFLTSFFVLGASIPRSKLRAALGGNLFLIGAMLPFMAGYIFLVGSIYSTYVVAPQLPCGCCTTQPSTVAVRPPLVLPTPTEEGEFFAVQTLTSVGYGMMLNAAHSEDFILFATRVMAIGGALWALSAGAAASVFYDLWKMVWGDYAS